MTYKDYHAMKWGTQESVGMFGNEIYAYEILTGINRVSCYIQIKKAEFDTFEDWSEAERTAVNRRPYLCQAGEAFGEIIEYDTEVHCPVCHHNFLLSHRRPEHIPIESCCPECRQWSDRQMNLVAELERQLKKAGLVMRDLYSELRWLYLEPYAEADMYGYVKVGPDCYYLKVAEWGRPVLEYCVEDIHEAAYWILFQLVEKAVESGVVGIADDDVLRERRKKESMRRYFEKMDLVYLEWFDKGRSLEHFNVDEADKSIDFRWRRPQIFRW